MNLGIERGTDIARLGLQELVADADISLEFASLDNDRDFGSTFFFAFANIVYCAMLNRPVITPSHDQLWG